VIDEQERLVDDIGALHNKLIVLIAPLAVVKLGCWEILQQSGKCSQ
jgi:hypothetical protein